MTPAARKEYLAKRAALASQVTVWFNPWKVPQRFTLILSGDTPTQFEVPPGGRVHIPSIHDQEIQTVQNGAVVGGQAPCLVNETASPRPTLHQEHAKANRHLFIVQPSEPGSEAEADLDAATRPDPKPAKK